MTNILKKIRSAKKVEEVEKFLSSNNLAAIVEVIRHDSLGPLIHDRYYLDERSSIRFEISNHKGVSEKILLKLGEDKNQLVRTSAKRRLTDIELEKKRAEKKVTEKPKKIEKKIAKKKLKKEAKEKAK